MNTLTITLPRPHPAQQLIILEARRFNVVNCGRRFGKSLLGQNRLIAPEVLAYPVAWFSPSYKDMLEVWRDMTRTLRPITSRRNTQERRIENIAGGLIEFWSLDNPDAGRGRKYRRIIVDEAAKVADLVTIWNETLRPTLADYAGDAWFLSTPRGHNGFWRLYQYGLDPELPDWACWKMPTAANPYIAQAEIDAMRGQLPERSYQQEILADFIDDSGGVFRRVTEAATGVILDRATDNGRKWIVGVDWGQSNDFTVIIVVDPDRRAVVAIDRFNQIDYQVQIDRLSAILTRFPPLTIIAERNSMGQPLVESLARQGLPVQPFTTTAASKAAAIQALQLAFERGEITIPPDPVLVGELQAYEAKRLPSGLFRYEAPAGMHDDTVMALALAWHGVSTAGSPMVIQPVKRSAWGEQPLTGRWKM